ncbi:tetratricopeptide repeat protein [Roseivirga sp. BDSF3-8]|uniref:ATP-binding protein n=1 Tax=Roseivirga sp. BDSF3-8 TaxID=3241598 RepID=UPI0035328090
MSISLHISSIGRVITAFVFSFLVISGYSVSGQELERDSVYFKQLDSLFYKIYEVGQVSPAKSLPILREAELMAKKYNDTVNLAYLKMQGGYIESKLGNYQLALDLYLSAYEFFKNDKDTITRADILNGLGVVYHDIGDNEKALEYYDQAYEIFSSLGDQYGEATILNNYGEMYFEDEDYSTALAYYIKTLEVYRDLEMELEAAVPLHNIGRVYKELGEYERAIKYLNEALEIDNKNNDMGGVAEDYQELGRVYQDAGMYEQAQANYERGLEVARKMKIRPILQSTYKALSENYKITGDQKVALEYYKAYLALKDSLLNDDVQKEMAQVQTRFELDQKDKEIEYLEIQQEIDENIIRDRNIKLAIGTGLALLVLVIMAILYSRFRIKLKTKNQLEDNNTLIDQRSKELKDTNQKLKQSKTRLKELNGTKDKFFSIISHDLKSPLRSLSGLFRILIDHADKLSREEIMALTSKLDHSVSNLSILLDNLLQWSMTQMGNVSYQPSTIQIAEPISETVRLLKPEADHKKISLMLNVIDKGNVFADRNMITFIIRNLVSNAIKFTPTGGKVKVNIFDKNGYYMVQVSDNGIGIPEENINKLFRLETSFTTAGTQQEKGTGLGLILCREFAVKNGGDISIESEEGKGTVFTVSLPKAMHHEMATVNS